MVIIVTLPNGMKRRFFDTPDVRYPMGFDEFEHSVDADGNLAVWRHHQQEQSPGDYTEYVSDTVVGRWAAGEWTDVEVLSDAEGAAYAVPDAAPAPAAMSRNPSVLSYDLSKQIGPCFRCGRPDGVWLVTIPDQGQARTGKLLRYCDTCREEMHEHLLLTLPTWLLAVDGDALMMLLYREGLVDSDPTTLADLLGDHGSWVAMAYRLLTPD